MFNIPTWRQRPETKPQAYVTAAIVINSVFAIGIAGLHTQLLRASFFRPVFFQDMLPWVIALNLVSATLLTVFYDKADARCRKLVSADLVVSVVPFLLFACLRIRTDRQMVFFGFVYTLFIFGHCAVFVSYAFTRTLISGPIELSRCWIFATTVAIYIAITPWVVATSWPNGDEPAYLMLMQSLGADHDFDLANNYAHHDYKQFFPPVLPGSEAGYSLAARMNDTMTAIGQQHETILNQSGQEMPVHDVGQPLLLLPGYSLGGRMGATVEVNIISALLAVGIFQLSWQISGSRAKAFWSWALFAFTCPLLVYTSELWVEAVGACLTVWAVTALHLFLKTGKWSLLLGAGLLAAVMPWICIRFWALAGPLLGMIALYILLTRNRRATLRSLLDLAAISIPMILSFALFAWFDTIHYGTWKPNAGYLIWGSQHPQFSFHPGIGLLGVFLDRCQGLLPVAPVYALGFAGACELLRRRSWETALLLFPAAIYLVFVESSAHWWGDLSPNARFAVAGIAIAPALASLVLGKRTRSLALGLALWGWVVALITTAVPLTRWPSLWDDRNGGISDFLREHGIVDMMKLFPSWRRAEPLDYATTFLWLVLIFSSAWWLVATSKSPSTKNEL